jgi:hypothetical protein
VVGGGVDGCADLKFFRRITVALWLDSNMRTGLPEKGDVREQFVCLRVQSEC